MTDAGKAGTADAEDDLIDVDALMADIELRVADGIKRGAYSVEALLESAPDATEPFGIEELERLRDAARPNVDLRVRTSTKPVIGPIVTRIKQALARATSDPLVHSSQHAAAFNSQMIAYTALLGIEIERLRMRLTELEDAGRSHGGSST